MRTRVLALAGLLALPALAAAQNRTLPEIPNPHQVPVARFVVTPFVGMRVPYTTGDEYLVTRSNQSYRVEEDRGGGAMVGAEFEGRVRGPLGVAGSLAYGGSSTTSITLTNASGEQQALTTAGPTMWMAKLAATYRLPDPRPDTRRFHPTAVLVAGPALVRTDFRNDDEIGAEWSGGTNNWGLNLGVHTATLIGPSPRLALHLGLEDFVTFWNTGRFEAREAAVYTSFLSQETSARIDYSASNVVMLRAGLSFRF